MRISLHLASVLSALAISLAAPHTLQAASWLTNSSMNAIRWNHAATLLPNGKVLFTGGYDGSGYYATSSAALYYPGTTTWTNTGSMPVSRGHHTATLLPNGQVLVTGGFDIRPPSGTPQSNVMVYFPGTGTWLQTNALSTRRAWHTATLLSNGKVLVVGGFGMGIYPTSTELFDPATGTWTVTGSLATARAEHTATLLPNGKVLVAGGHNGSSGPLSTCEVYNPGTGLWTAAFPLSAARYNHTATLLPNGKVLVTGGFGGGASAELYDPATGFWSPTGPMANQRRYHTATLLPNGRVLVTAGQNLVSTVLSSAELYDPNVGTWSNGGVMTTNRQNHTATLLPDGQVLVAGGNLSIGYPNLTELYVPDGLSPTSIFLDSAARLPGGFRFAFTNIPIPGAAFTVYSTTNPALSIGNWSLLGGATDLLPGKFEFTDAQANDFEMRFYRVVGP